MNDKFEHKEEGSGKKDEGDEIWRRVEHKHVSHQFTLVRSRLTPRANNYYVTIMKSYGVQITVYSGQLAHVYRQKWSDRSRPPVRSGIVDQPVDRVSTASQAHSVQSPGLIAMHQLRRSSSWTGPRKPCRNARYTNSPFAQPLQLAVNDVFHTLCYCHLDAGNS